MWSSEKIGVSTAARVFTVFLILKTYTNTIDLSWLFEVEVSTSWFLRESEKKNICEALKEAHEKYQDPTIGMFMDARSHVWISIFLDDHD